MRRWQMLLADLGTLELWSCRAPRRQTDCHSHQTESQTWVRHAKNWNISFCFHEVTWIQFFCFFPHLSYPSLDVILLECVLKWHKWQEILSKADVMTHVTGAFCVDFRLTSHVGMTNDFDLQTNVNHRWAWTHECNLITYLRRINEHFTFDWNKTSGPELIFFSHQQDILLPRLKWNNRQFNLNRSLELRSFTIFKKAKMGVVM